MRLERPEQENAAQADEGLDIGDMQHGAQAGDNATREIELAAQIRGRRHRQEGVDIMVGNFTVTSLLARRLRRRLIREQFHLHG
jgi:hypothetical protein